MVISLETGLDKKEIIENIKKRMMNKKWLYENYDEIREEHAYEYVAIDNEQIINSDKNRNHLREKLKEEFQKIDHILIELINSKNIRLLL